MLELENFIKTHNNWLELIQQKPYNIKVVEDDNYYLLRYTQLDVVDGGSDFSEPIVQECRGLIIDKLTLKPKALSFKKFFNIQEELHSQIDWENAQVQEKIDGSKLLLFFNNYINKWQLTTSGTLNAYNTKIDGQEYTFGDLFNEALSVISIYEYLDENKCYTFEIVSPKARIVVPYKQTKLYLIGVRNVDTFEELDTQSEPLSKLVSTPKKYPLHNLQDCLNATDKMGFDNEGFVVVDDSWNRVKIKSPAYVAVHYLRFNGTPSNARLLNLIENGKENLITQYYPEYKQQFEDLHNKLNDLHTRFKLAVKKVVDFNEEHTRKDTAEFILNNYQDISGLLFRFIDTDIYDLFLDAQWGKFPNSKKLQLLGLKEEKDADEFKEE